MNDGELRDHINAGLQGTGLDERLLDALAGQLVWRIGRLGDDAPVTVRVGLASSVPMFNELPKLRSASEAELEAAVRENALRVEWVGRAPA